jgi:hypothetical protein
MIWKTMFKAGEIVTENDTKALEQLDEATNELRELAARIDREWPTSGNRGDVIRQLAVKLIQRPGDEKTFQAMTVAACMPSSPQFGYQHRDWALGPINEEIAKRLLPQHPIVRRCFRRALDQAEAELKRTESAERKAAQNEGYDFSPSGRVLALQQKVLNLRNEIAAAVPGEENCIHAPPHWRERLREWL